MKPTKFTVVLKPEVVVREMTDANRLEFTVEGVEDLRDQLAEANISLADDVEVAFPEEITGIDIEIRRAALALESVGNHDLIIGHRNGWYVIVSVLDGGIIEYQVSDGLPNERNTSFDTYWYTEAMKLLVEWGDKEVIDAEFTIIEVDVLRIIYDKVCVALTQRCNGSMVTSRIGEDLMATFDIDASRNIRGTSARFGWHDDEWDDEDGENPHKYGDGDLMVEPFTPGRIESETDCLDLVLRTLFDIEELTVRDLSTDGDHKSCEAIFYVDEAQAYVRVAFC